LSEASSTPTPAPRIASLRLKRGERVKVELDDGRSLDVDAEVVLRAGLRKGDPLDEALEAQLLDSDLRARARAASFSLLSARARSRKELGDRLRRKDFPSGVVEDCLDALETAGWLDDVAFARSMVRDRLRLRPRGPGRMTQELRNKGVSEEVARAAVASVFDEEDVSVPDLALEVARGWLRRQPPAMRDALLAHEFTPERDRAGRRFFAFLARRGFTGTSARAALDRMRDDV
jgi:regulatory protein